MIAIKRIGSYLETDANGFLVPVADTAKVGEAWRPAVEMLIAGYREGWGDALHSVYVRGSLVKGQAVEGYSDLDSFGVLRLGADEGGAKVWARDLEAEIVLSYRGGR